MTRAGWEFLRTDRPELNMPSWEALPARHQLALLNVDPEEIITKNAALRLMDYNMTWDTFLQSLLWAKDWTFYPEVHD